MLNDAQYDYLQDECQDINRMMCFRTFISMAVMEKTTVSKKNFSADLQPGQFMASKVELSARWKCNRKTATRIVKEFNQMDFLHSEPSNRTTIHSLKCLSDWVTDEGTVENSFFDSNPMVKPIGKQDKDVHVPPVDEREPTENDNAIPLAPAVTSVADDDEKNDAGQPSEASVEGKKELVAEPPSPSRIEDAPVGKVDKPRQSTRHKKVAAAKKKPRQLYLWDIIEVDGNDDVMPPGSTDDSQDNNSPSTPSETL